MCLPESFWFEGSSRCLRIVGFEGSRAMTEVIHGGVKYKGITKLTRNKKDKYQVYNGKDYVGLYNSPGEALRALVATSGLGKKALEADDSSKVVDGEEECIVYNNVYKAGSMFEARYGGNYFGRFSSQRQAADAVAAQTGDK